MLAKGPSRLCSLGTKQAVPYQRYAAAGGAMRLQIVAGLCAAAHPSAPRPWPAGAAGLLSAGQLSHMADYFTNALCCLKHNGAVDKTQQGFAALCERCVQGRRGEKV